MRLAGRLTIVPTWLCFIGLITTVGHCTSGAELAPRIVRVSKIWDKAPHNAFTDLVRWKEQFYCAFREGKGHAGDIGKLRIIVSGDGTDWKSVALLSMDDYDLRDAAISVTPDDRLMVLGGAQQLSDGSRRTGTFVSFSENGRRFSAPTIVVQPGRWLWRVTWHEGVAYGVSYATPDGQPFSALHSSRDGSHFEMVTDTLYGKSRPSEARLRFDAEGTCYCLHRCDGPANSAVLGVASAPYKNWKWHDLGSRIGGPNFIQLPSGHWIGAGRLYQGGARTELVHLDMNKGTMSPLLRLPSGGDTSYPGMVWHAGHLWVSYYSSHEDKGASVYLAQVEFPQLQAPVEIGTRREIFVDRHIIDRLDGTALRLHHPRPAEQVLRFDKPWEGPFCGYATVIKDDSRYRMYYRGLPLAGRDGSNTEVTCYAESRDGIHWDKPELNLFEVGGTRANNVVLHNETPASHNFSPFRDENPKAEESQQFKALGGTSKGLIAFVSADGIRWRRLRQEPVFTQGIFDSQNVSFWSESERRYVCYFRTWTKRGFSGFRTISRTTSEDFVHWTDPVKMTFGDTPDEHLYTNQTNPYFRAPHIYIGVAARFMPGRQVLTSEEAKAIGVNPSYFGDISDAVLLSSRGGNRYDRTFMESFIRPGRGAENWVSRTNYPALGIVPTADDELSVYLQKNYGQPSSLLQRYTFRTDGFTSVSAGYDGGEMVTKPLVFSGRELQLNFATSAAGSIRVEVQDASGQPIPTFTLEDGVELIGDQINQVVSWRGGAQLQDLAGKPVRFRFVMKDADLYALQVR